MRILHLIQKPQNRGAETFACQLARHQEKLGNEVKVVSVFTGNAILPWKKEIESLEASVNKRFLDLKAWKKLNRIIRKFNPDIIQANSADTLKYAVFSKKIFGWKNLLISRNASEIGRYIKSPLQKRLNSFFYRNVKIVISVSKASEKDILNLFPFLIGKTIVIPVGLETTSRIEGIKFKPQDSQHIVHVGGFTFEKNHIGILKIFKSVLNSNSNVHLHLIGDGPLKSQIEKEVKNMGLTSKISFYGFVDNPLSFIKAGDIFILPSIIEGLPAVILEAMFCEVPVIAYNVGGISEIVFNGETGCLIEKNDETGFASAINETLQDYKKNSFRIDQAKKLVTDNFLNEIIADRFQNCYYKLLNDQRSSSQNEMTILQIVIKRQFRGAELFAADLSAELIKLGHSVTFAGLYGNDEDVLSVGNADNRDLVSSKDGKFSLDIVKNIIRLVKEIKPDIIQCNGTDTLKYAVTASYFFGKDIPLVYRNKNIISEWISIWPKKLIYKKMFRHISYVTSVGDEALGDFIKAYNYPNSWTEVIRRGIPIKGMDKDKLYKELRNYLGFNEKTKIALHLGNFCPEKNHRFLLEIFDELKNETSDIKLISVGNGILHEKMKQIVEEKGLSQKVFFLGFRKEISELLAASDCLVLCSKVEGVPGVILEAATQKIPSVSTNVGGVSKVLVDGQTGFLINNIDKNEFKDKLIELMTNNELRESFGLNAYKMVSKGCDSKSNAKNGEAL